MTEEKGLYDYLCRNCQHTARPRVKLSFMPNALYSNDLRQPKYAVMVKLYCDNCSSWITHLKQTDELMEFLSDKVILIEQTPREKLC